ANDPLPVHGVAERAANAHVVEGFDPRVEADVKEAEGGFPEYLEVAVSRVGVDLFRLAARDERLLELALEELGEHLLVRRADPERHAVHEGPSLVVTVVRLEHDLLVLIPAGELERTRSHGRATEALFLPFDLLARDHGGVRQAEHGEERRERLVERDPQRVAVDGFQPLDLWARP